MKIKRLCCIIIAFSFLSGTAAGNAGNSCYSEVSLNNLPFSRDSEFPAYISPEIEYSLSFSDDLDADSVDVTNLYLNDNELTDEDADVMAEENNLKIVFKNPAISEGVEYKLDINGIRASDGKIITVPSMYLKGAGNIPVTWDVYLKKGLDKVKFNGNAEGKVGVEAQVKNNTLSDLELELICETDNDNFENTKSELITVRTGEEKKLVCETVVTRGSHAFAYVQKSDGTHITEKICLTEKTTPVSYYLVDERFATALKDQYGTPLFSGWRINRGRKTINKVDYLPYNSAVLKDSSMGNRITMEKSFLSQSDGVLTFEAGFTPSNSSGQFEISLIGYRGEEHVTAMRIFTTKTNVAISDGINRIMAETLSDNKDYNFKIIANLNNSTFSAYLNGRLIKKDADFIQCADFINSVKISTPGEGVMDVGINYVRLYKNYGVNETFMCAGNELDEWTRNKENVYVENQYGMFDSDSNCIALGNASLRGTIEKELDYIPENPEISLSFKLNEESVLGISVFGNNNSVNISREVMTFGNCSYSLKKGIWYTLSMRKSGACNKVYINGIFIGEIAIPFISPCISISGTNGVCVDDIYVKERECTSLAVSKPADDGYSIHMMSYPMWNEGSHYGWDRIAEYPERTPLMGFYDDCNEEAMNLQIKWLAEHCVDVIVFPFARLTGNCNSAIKNTQRETALLSYKNAELADKINYAVMWSAISESTFGGKDDFRNNIVPYWIEHYFKDNKYAILDNKPVLYIYNPDKLINILGGVSALKQELDYLDQEAIKNGFDGVYTIANLEGAQLTDTGIDSIFSYAVLGNGGVAVTQMQTLKMLEAQAKVFGTDVPAAAYMGFDSLPWRGNAEGRGTTITPSAFKKYLIELKETRLSAGNSKKILYLGTWNEYGEGHFFMPTKLYGFGYLDAVREVFSGYDAEHTDWIPDYTGLKRYGTMYTGLGAPSKLYNKSKEVSPDFTEVVKGWYFGNAQDRAEWNVKYAEKSAGSNGQTMLLTYKNAASEPEIDVDISQDKINAADIRYIRVTMKADLSKIDGKLFIMHFTTDEKPALYSNSSMKSFLVSDKLRTYVIDTHNNADWKGTLEKLYIWPVHVATKSCIPGTECEIMSIELLK